MTDPQFPHIKHPLTAGSTGNFTADQVLQNIRNVMDSMKPVRESVSKMVDEYFERAYEQWKDFPRHWIRVRVVETGGRLSVLSMIDPLYWPIGSKMTDEGMVYEPPTAEQIEESLGKPRFSEEDRERMTRMFLDYYHRKAPARGV